MKNSTKFSQSNFFTRLKINVNKFAFYIVLLIVNSYLIADEDKDVQCRSLTTINHESLDSFAKLFYTDNSFAPKLICENGTYNIQFTTPLCQKFTLDEEGRVKVVEKGDGTIIKYTYHEDGVEISCQSDLHYRYYINKTKNEVIAVDLINNTRSISAFEKENRTITDTLSSGLVIKRQFDQLENPTSVVLPDNSKIEYVYDDSKLVEIKRLSAKGVLLYSHKYKCYAENGYPLLEEFVAGGGMLHTKLDKQQRVIELISPYHAVKAAQIADDNLAKKEISTLFGQRDLNYNELDSVIKSEQKFYQNESSLPYLIENNSGRYFYDLNGRCCRKETKNHIVKYRYDSLDRLIAIEDEKARQEFSYDGWGRRILSKTFLLQDKKWVLIDKKKYIFLGDIEFGSRNRKGKIDELKLTAPFTDRAVAIELNETLFIPLHDLQGNVVALANPKTRSIVATYKANLFGNEEIIAGEKLKNPWRFADKRSLSIDTLVFFGNRPYDQENCRWLTPINLKELSYYPVERSIYKGWDRWPISSLYNSCTTLMRQMNPLVNSIKDTLSYGGQVANILGSYLLSSLPFIPDACIYIGKLLQFDFTPTYVSRLERRGNLNPKMAFLFVNGIKNYLPEITESADFISEKIGNDVPFYIEFVPFRGWILDLLEGACWKTGFDTKNVTELRREIRGILPTLQKDGRLHIIAHSRGVMLTIETLKGMHQYELDKITLDAFATPQIADTSLAKEVHNVNSVKDIYGFIDFGGIVRHFLFGENNLLFIKNDETLPYTEHFFANPAYQRYLAERIKHYFEEDLGIVTIK